MTRRDSELAGLPWVKRRAGCYSRDLPGTRLRLILLRNVRGLWTGSAVLVGGRDRAGTIIWKSGMVPSAGSAAVLLLAWVDGPFTNPK